MSNKPCTKCGRTPRMVSNSGKELTMCEPCQRDYWRNRYKKVEKKAKKPPAPMPVAKSQADLYRHTRTCKQCEQTKPLSEFATWGGGYKVKCKQCVDIGKARSIQTPKRERIVLINGDQVILAEVISQKPNVNCKELVVGLYEQQGYEIVNVFEAEGE